MLFLSFEDPARSDGDNSGDGDGDGDGDSDHGDSRREACVAGGGRCPLGAGAVLRSSCSTDIHRRKVAVTPRAAPPPPPPPPPSSK